jgi:hypothetical protein
MYIGLVSSNIVGIIWMIGSNIEDLFQFGGHVQRGGNI